MAKVRDTRAVSNAHGPPDEPERCNAFRRDPTAPFARARRCERRDHPDTPGWCVSHPGDWDYSSPSYFSTTADCPAWLCRLTPAQVDAALLRAEGLRTGTIQPKLGPVDTSTQLLNEPRDPNRGSWRKAR